MTTTEWRHIPTNQFQALGVQQMAFIKPVRNNDEVAYAVHAADGTQMAVIGDRDVAFAAVLQHGLQPLSVH